MQPDSPFWMSAIAYGLALVGATYMWIRGYILENSSWKEKLLLARSSISFWIRTLIVLSLASRFIWMLTKWDPHIYDDSSFVRSINRIGFFLIFASFSFMILGWLMQYGGEMNSALKYMFLVFVVVVLAVSLTTLEQYTFNICFLVFSQLIVAIFLGVTGAMLKKKLMRFAQSNLIRGYGKRLTIVVILSVTVFAIRATMFSLAPLHMDFSHGSLLDTLTYPWFFYTIPDITASFALLFATKVTERSSTTPYRKPLLPIVQRASSTMLKLDDYKPPSEVKTLHPQFQLPFSDSDSD